MPEPSSFDYAAVRIVPDIERGEFLNVGVILFCRTLRFLGVRFDLDAVRLRCLAPGCDLADLQPHLDSMARICDGGAGAGPIGRLSQSERFHWLVAPRSTVIQTSPVHPGLCTDPAGALDRLLDKLVRQDLG